MDGPDLAAAESVIEEVGRLTLVEADRVAAALAVAKQDPSFEHCRFCIEVGVRLDCAANVEGEMLRTVAAITAAMPVAPTEEPWRSAWEAAVDAACAHIGGFYAYPELSPPLLMAWGARTGATGQASRGRP